ncbi:MAG: DUF1841 family protein [Pseudomonadota bacterium]
MFGSDRGELRRMYANAWQRALQQVELTALEREIVAVIRDHPEYRSIVESQLGDAPPDDAKVAQAFLHMGLHLAVREQLSTDRPKGIRDIFHKLIEHSQDSHTVEHRCAEVLGDCMWQAQQAGRMPDEQGYLERLRALL